MAYGGVYIIRSIGKTDITVMPLAIITAMDCSEDGHNCCI